MLMPGFMALDNLSKTIPPIDSDQKVASLHAPIKGTTFFGGELAKLCKANKERANSVIVYPALLGKMAPPAGGVAGIEIRVDPPLRPQLLNSPSLGMVKPP